VHHPRAGLAFAAHRLPALSGGDGLFRGVLATPEKRSPMNGKPPRFPPGDLSRTNHR